MRLTSPSIRRMLRSSGCVRAKLDRQGMDGRRVDLRSIGLIQDSRVAAKRKVPSVGAIKRDRSSQRLWPCLHSVCPKAASSIRTTSPDDCGFFLVISGPSSAANGCQLVVHSKQSALRPLRNEPCGSANGWPAPAVGRVLSPGRPAHPSSPSASRRAYTNVGHSGAASMLSWA